MEQQLIKAAAIEAARLGIEPATLAAVALVESGGQAFACVDGRNEPLIRFEGHYFDRRLQGKARSRARAEGLAAPVPGAVRNPAGQAARWQMLARAAEIDRRAAFESCSYGVGQIMGAHWKRLGYADVEAMVADARSGLEGQVRLMARFIEVNGLAPALARRDWADFARAYNGPGYASNAYDRKLAAARARLAALLPATQEPQQPPRAPALKRGDSGAAVRDLQQMLCARGFACPQDGAFGDRTLAALKAFQKRAGLKADGICGPATSAALSKSLPRLNLFSAWLSLLKLLSRLFSKSI